MDGDSSGEPNHFQTLVAITQVEAYFSMIHYWVVVFLIETGIQTATDEGRGGCYDLSTSKKIIRLSPMETAEVDKSTLLEPRAYIEADGWTRNGGVYADFNGSARNSRTASLSFPVTEIENLAMPLSDLAVLLARAIFEVPFENAAIMSGTECEGW